MRHTARDIDGFPLRSIRQASLVLILLYVPNLLTTKYDVHHTSVALPLQSRQLQHLPRLFTYSLFTSLLIYSPYYSEIDDIPWSPETKCAPRFTADDNPSASCRTDQRCSATDQISSCITSTSNSRRVTYLKPNAPLEGRCDRLESQGIAQPDRKVERDQIAL